MFTFGTWIVSFTGTKIVRWRGTWIVSGTHRTTGRVTATCCSTHVVTGRYWMQAVAPPHWPQPPPHLVAAGMRTGHDRDHRRGGDPLRLVADLRLHDRTHLRDRHDLVDALGNHARD